MRRTSLLAALFVSVVLFLPGCNLASRNRVQAINRMNEGIQLFDKNNTAGAEKALQDAIQLDPTYAAAYHTLGQIYKKQNKLVDAEKAFQGAIDNMKTEPNAEYYYDLGAVQTAQGEVDGVAAAERETKYRAAINSFQEALKLDPKQYKAHYRMGTLHEKLDEPEKADGAYRKTIEIKPSYSPAFVSLGNMYIDYGFANVAMVVLQTGAQINDKDARMWNGLGRAHFELGEMQKAIDAYSKAKAIDPDGVDALYGLGMAYAELRQRKEAKENLELFISKAGQDTRPDLIKAARDTVARMADVI
jgi:tetratricopeptide (TPR) repeat protein